MTDKSGWNSTQLNSIAEPAFLPIASLYPKAPFDRARARKLGSY